jgi:hypothetical protein
MIDLNNLQPPYEPKVKNRFVVTLPEELGLPSWLIHSTERPRFGTNGYHLIPEPLKFVLRDPITPSTTQAVWELLSGLTDIEAGTEINPELKIELQKKYQKFQQGFDYTLELLDPLGVVVEKWTITGCKLIRIDFGNLDYSNSEMVDITLIFRPVRAYLEF